METRNELLAKIDRKLYHVMNLNYELYFKEADYKELSHDVHHKLNQLVTQIQRLKTVVNA